MNANSTGRIYVYSAPGYDTEWTRTLGATTVEGRGRFKVGYTGRKDPRVRIKEQTGTLYPGGEDIVIHIDEPAVREDGTTFDDHAVHAILDSAGVQRHSEVVEATLDEIRAAIAAVRAGRPYDPLRTCDFGLRPEQREAVEQSAAYFQSHAADANPARFLWNAKMRFGKTFAAYKLAQRMEWRRVLVLTYKPVVRDAWRDDLQTHVDFADWVFSDRENPRDPDTKSPGVWFASFQDLLGTNTDGEVKTHNENLHLIDWDCIIVDEYHFGAWQGAAKEACSPVAATSRTSGEAGEAENAAENADSVIDLAAAGTPRLLAATPDSEIPSDLSTEDLRLSGRCFLYLSGTPFRALTEGEFNEDAIFNWTYPDEQNAKRQWDRNSALDPERNPYRELPQMQMYTYGLSQLESVPTDEEPGQMFDLSGFFEAKKIGSEYHFTDPERVGEFLNMLRGRLAQSVIDKLMTDFRPPFPYSDGRFAGAVDHTVWYLPTVASAHAMKATLSVHPFFRDFLVHVSAGNAARMGAEAKKPVDRMLAEAAKHNKQTITLSVGKLMTGVTVPQWGAILVLRSMKSPESYFQAAFRVQSPWVKRNPDGTRSIQKDTCFVFDFDPNRALSLMYQYGTKLASGATRTVPSEVIDELIRYLPIYAFADGTMVEVDVDRVMNWGTAGAGAAMLAKRWGSPRLVDLSEAVLERLLSNTALVERLEQMEDFRDLRQNTTKIIAQSRKLKAAKSRQRSQSDADEDPELVAAKREKREQLQALRKKLIKFLQTVPVFMYLTDFREEALVDVIEALDTQLFERVTGLTIEDFRMLSEVGVFNPLHMNEAIWQFRLFERASLDYLSEDSADVGPARIGLWDRDEAVPTHAKSPGRRNS